MKSYNRWVRQSEALRFSKKNFVLTYCYIHLVLIERSRVFLNDIREISIINYFHGFFFSFILEKLETFWNFFLIFHRIV